MAETEAGGSGARSEKGSEVGKGEGKGEGEGRRDRDSEWSTAHLRFTLSSSPLSLSLQALFYQASGNSQPFSVRLGSVRFGSGQEHGGLAVFGGCFGQW